MYNIKVSVELSEQGKKLLNKENYDCVMHANLEQMQLQDKKYLLDLFVKSIMPEGMFCPKSFNASVIGYAPECGECLSVAIQVNSCTTVYIPFEVCEVDTAYFKLKTIDDFNYDYYDNNLMNSSFTKRTFNVVNKIDNYKFDIVSLKPIKSNVKLNIIANPMNPVEVQEIKDKINRNKIYNIAYEKVQELKDKMLLFDTRKLKDLVEMIDTICDEEYDGFGM
ncbi:hypothetical protein [uncultured Methanobrevibacter sp.]|uniref:hypothetical protein n=1 Tax=uncultured Methanobrevibacter sp. TaxID=253161 RepID=UPI0025E6DCA2|nr:hypothetical protein [uncultured Methanobrevibacter sp.]